MLFLMNVCRFLIMHVRLVLEGGIANLQYMVWRGLHVCVVCVLWCLLRCRHLPVSWPCHFP